MIAICSRFCGPGRGGLLMVPVGTMGPFWPGVALSGLRGRGACGLCPRFRARRTRA